MFSFFEVTDGCNWVEEWTTSVNELQDRGVGGSTLFFRRAWSIVRLQVSNLALSIQTCVKSGGEDLKAPSAKMVSMTKVLNACDT